MSDVKPIMFPYLFAVLSFVPLLLAGVVQVPVHHTIVSGSKIPYDPGNFVEYRTINVSIGTPPQRFNLTLNTYSFFAYVFDASLQKSLYTYCSAKGRGGRRHLFDATKSSTYGNVSDSNYPFDLDDSEYFSYCGNDNPFLPLGDAAMDKVQIGPLSTRTKIGLIKTPNAALQPFWASDGVFGLSRVDGMPIPGTPTWVAIAKAATGRAVATLAGGEDASTLTLGGDDTVNCTGKWAEFAQADPDYLVDWHFRVKAVKLGAYSNKQATIGTIGSGTKTRVPKGAFAYLVKSTGAEYDFRSDEYVVACSSIPSLSDLVLHLDNGYDYRMPASVYVSKVALRKDGKCTLMLEENILVDQNFWTLGWHALTHKCWRFDYAADTLSFADMKP